MKRLTKLGIHTALVSPFPMRHDAWQVVEGFRELHDTGGDGHETAEAIYPHAEEWLDENATDEDWYLHVNFWDPHAKYDVPLDYGRPFADEPAPEWLTEDRIESQRESYGHHCAREPHPSLLDIPLDEYLVDHSRMPPEIASREDFKEWIDGYDSAIRYMDDYIGKLLDLLREKGVYEDTYVVVSADHAENLGELNVYGDHYTCNDTVANVPLIMSGPDVRDGVDDDLHYQLDLPPTVVELAGGDPPNGWDGQPFTPTVTDDVSTGRDALVVSHGFGSCQRGVRWDDWFLLRTYHEGLHGALEDLMLFDLEVDPHETTNLAADRPEVVDRGLAILQRWHDERMVEAGIGTNGGNPDTPDGVTDPMWQVLREGGPLPTRVGIGTYPERLRATGRGEHAETLERRLNETAQSYLGP